MSAVRSEQALSHRAVPAVSARQRFPSYGADPTVLADIYQEDINIAIWERELSERLKEAIGSFSASNPHFRASMIVSPESACAAVGEALGSSAPAELADDVAELVDMFCCLFELQCAGLRLTALDRAMCPRFHVDRVPCRLVTTYHGVTTEWLSHQVVDRSKLGHRSKGQSDLESGLVADHSNIQQLTCGDVALLKGENWVGNENAGLVHRSPVVPEGENRLLLTLDVCD